MEDVLDCACVIFCVLGCNSVLSVDMNCLNPDEYTT